MNRPTAQQHRSCSRKNHLSFAFNTFPLFSSFKTSTFTSQPLHTSLSCKSLLHHVPVRHHHRLSPLPNIPKATLAVPLALKPIIDKLSTPVIKISFRAVSKLLATAFFGVAAAKRGILDDQVLRALSKTLYWIFLPAVLLVNVCKTMTMGLGGGLAWMPLAALLSISSGLLLGRVFARVLKLTKSEEPLFVVSCGFANSAALPLLFSNALFGHAPASLATFVSSISCYLMLWTPLFWSIGYGILANAPDDDDAITKITYGKPITSPPPQQTKVAFSKSSMLPSLSFIQSSFSRILSPPLIGSAIGLALGIIPKIRTMFLNSVFFDALSTLGTAYAPVAILVLAGNFARPRKRTRMAEQHTIRWRRLAFGISLVRFIAMPLAALALTNTVPLWSNPGVKLALLLESTMPAAQNSVVILTLEDKKNMAAAMAKVLFAVYIAGVIPISLSLGGFLALTGFK